MKSGPHTGGMRFIFVSCVLVLAGCATSTEPATADDSARAQLGTEFTLSLGDTIRLNGSPHRVKFVQVLEDSRCPVETACIWEGNARIQIAVDATVMELNTSSRFPKLTDALGLIFELRKLEPAPRADTPTTGYRATLFASKP